MQLSWLFHGLRTGVLTTRYPDRPETLPGNVRGRPVVDGTRCQGGSGCDACVRACLPGAITLRAGTSEDPAIQFSLNYGACIMCGLCVTACPHDALALRPEYELATRRSVDLIDVVDLRKEGGDGEPRNGHPAN